MKVTMEPEASDRLFMASAVIETEPVRVPTSSLNANSSKLHTMPVRPDSVPMAARTLGFSVLSASFTNRRSSKLVMIFLQIRDSTHGRVGFLPPVGLASRVSPRKGVTSSGDYCMMLW